MGYVWIMGYVWVREGKELLGDEMRRSGEVHLRYLSMARERVKWLVG